MSSPPAARQCDSVSTTRVSVLRPGQTTCTAWPIGSHALGESDTFEPGSASFVSGWWHNGVQTGPVLMFYRQNVMARIEYKALVYERDRIWHGGYVSVSIGFVF